MTNMVNLLRPSLSAKGTAPTPEAGSGVKGAKRRRRREPLMPLPVSGTLKKPRAVPFSGGIGPQERAKTGESSAPKALFPGSRWDWRRRARRRVKGEA